ncbi:MAG: hypothetical protein ABIP55_05430 [Tepidisphaeraceae bacterium]
MKVHVVRSVCEVEVPGEGPRQVYASVNHDSSRLDLVEYFDGKPYPRKWKPVRLRLDKPRLRRPDFLNFDWKVLLCGPRAMEVVGDLLRASGQLFPVTMAGEGSAYQLHNITRMLKTVLDPKNSEFRALPGYKPLRVPAFRGDRIGPEVSLFKIPQNFGGQIYCVERTGKPEDGEFKALVDHHGLTGLEFKLVWTDGKTAKRPAALNPAKTKPAPVQPTGGSDRPLKAGEKKDIHLSIARGYEHLKLTPGTSPLKVQRAIRDLIDPIVLGRKKGSAKTVADLAVNLGCLWGQTICDIAGWEWCFAKVSGSAFYAIVTPNRSHVVAPMHFAQAQLKKRSPQDNTSLLLFNMIKSGKSLPTAKAKAYMHVG